MSDPDFYIQKYQLKPHPEGGYYREVYRSKQTVNSQTAKANRNTVTHIYFLLKKGQFSRFHRVLHDEIWNFYEGDPLKIIEFDGAVLEEKIIGKENDSYFSVVLGGIFQAAESIGEFSFVGCSVAPGFDFKDFSFLDDETELINKIKKEFTNYHYLI